MRVKSLGRSSIKVIGGVRMAVHVNNNGYVELRVKREDYDNAVEVLTRPEARL